jgi:hypothetical protein
MAKGFKKGDKKPENSGRKPGVQNKRTVRVKEAIEEVAAKLGGVDGLLKWVKKSPENQAVFWSSMYMRLLPIQVQGTGQNGALQLNINIKREDLARRLEEHGLPTMIFGIDVPQLELTAETINGNGSDANGGGKPPGACG